MSALDRELGLTFSNNAFSMLGEMLEWQLLEYERLMLRNPTPVLYLLHKLLTLYLLAVDYDAGFTESQDVLDIEGAFDQNLQELLIQRLYSTGRTYEATTHSTEHGTYKVTVERV